MEQFTQFWNFYEALGKIGTQAFKAGDFFNIF